MTATVHLHLAVSDLARSRAFYQAFFGEGPVKERPGYVKFLPAMAPVNLALTARGSALPQGRPLANHLGIQVETPTKVMAHLARLKTTGMRMEEEMGVSCCHANQDKFWVQDPDGVEWEVYHLNYDLEDEVAKPAKGLQMAKGNACCAS